ncbi:MAG: DUF7507 domain-containing protein [Wenzhouxiangella sp.]
MFSFKHRWNSSKAEHTGRQNRAYGRVRLGLVAVFVVWSGLAGAQTAPTNYNVRTVEAVPTDLNGVPGFGANYATGNTYNLRFGRIDASTLAQTPIIESFEVGPDLFIQVPRALPTPYDRVIVNRRVAGDVDNLNKFTGFFSNNGLSGNIADGSTVFYQSSFVTTLEGIINSYDIDRGADNIFANAMNVATRNNVQRIDMIIDEPLLVGAGALARTGILILERGGNDQLTVAAITGIDPVSGVVTSLGPLVKTSGPLGGIWGATGVARATTVFQNANATTGAQDIRPDQNLSSQNISGSFISLADLGVASGQPMHGLALFGNDVLPSMDLIGLSDVPLDTDGTANGGLDLMGGGGFFFSSQLELVKQANVATYAAVGDEIEYSFTLSNNGALTLTNVQVEDPMLGGVIPCNPSTLLAGETATCGPVVYTVTQADIDAGQIINVAQGSGLDPDGEPLFALDSDIVTGPPRVPGLEVEKLLTDAPSPVFAGDLIEFTINATNTGNITLSDVVVVDALLTPDSITCPSVAPQESCQLIGTYELTQADIDSGSFTNLGAAEAPNPLDPGGPALEDEDEIITPLPSSPQLVLDKIVTAGDPFAQVGDVIDYQLTATNIGNVTLSNVVISDPDIASLSCVPDQPAQLAPNETLVCTGSYSVLQSDIDSGSFTNLGTVNGEAPNGESASDTDEARADGPPAAPNLAVTKTLIDAPAPIIVGSVLTYTVTATNIGNVTLSDVLVVDALLNPDSILCPTVLPQEDCVLLGTYTVTQNDIDAGQITNIGSGEAPDPTDPGGPPLFDEEEIVNPLPQNPGLALDKVITAGNPYAAVGDLIDYQLTATNIGNVTLSNVSISDPDVGALSCTPAQPATLAPTETLVCTGSYSVTQDDVNAGSFTNTATANGTSPGGIPVSAVDDATADGPAGAPALDLVKALTNAPDPIVEGSVLTYTVTATNSGNVTLNNVLVSDTLIDPSSISCASLAPTESCVLIGTYTVNQQDINAGQIINTGSANSDETGPEDDTVTTPLDQNLALELAKVITAGNPFAVVGDLIDYQLTATNTGNVTLSNVSISDPAVGALNCTPAQPATLEPTETLVCTGSYAVIQDDIDAGSFTNIATVTGEGPGGIPVSDVDDATADGPAGTPSLIVSKALSAALDPIIPGSVLTYIVTASNNGNITLSNVVVSDILITPDSITCPTVAVNDVCVLVGTYTVTQDDLDAGEIANTGSGTAPDPTDPGGPPLFDDEELIVPLLQEPALTIEKVLSDAPDPIMVGSVLSYTITATNSGNVTLTNVVVSDSLIDPAEVICAILAVGESCVLTGAYTVAQADVDTGAVINTASALSDQTPDPLEDELTTPIDQNPAIELDKLLTSGNPYMAVGDLVEYELIATNIGDVTLTAVTITDSGATIDSCVPVQPATLAPDESLICAASYAVLQSDINAGSYTNTAVVTATTPNNDSISDTDTAVAVGPAGAAALGLVKVLQDPPSLILAGTELTYVIIATNIGNVTLFDVLIEDDMIMPSSVVCSVLEPAETCELMGTYVVQESDLERGVLINIATAVGNDLDNEPVPEVTDTVTTPLARPIPVPMTDRWALLLLALLLLTVAAVSILRQKA